MNKVCTTSRKDDKFQTGVRRVYMPADQPPPLSTLINALSFFCSVNFRRNGKICKTRSPDHIFDVNSFFIKLYFYRYTSDPFEYVYKGVFVNSPFKPMKKNFIMKELAGNLFEYKTANSTELPYAGIRKYLNTLSVSIYF